MNSPDLNFSTGPVNITKEVLQALNSPSISHRSGEFNLLYNDTSNFLCEQFNVKEIFIITGSGTASNEAMLWQIKAAGGKGLVLSNGEFGSRLIEQSLRINLEFIEYKTEWGEIFDIDKVEAMICENNLEWILFCHCETSTGVINDLNSLADICHKNDCYCFVDCMSTVGTYALDLSKVTMATASSGKGLACIPGLGIIFSNREAIISTKIPLYLDLGHYSSKSRIPFTISSNLINALNVSIRQKLTTSQFALIEHYSNDCYHILNEGNILAFPNKHSRVLTIIHHRSEPGLPAILKKEHIQISHESNYLITRDLCQIAFFGHYQERDLEKLLRVLKSVYLS